MKYIFFLFTLLISGCVKTTNQGSLQSLPKANAYVENYGQIVSANETRYVEYLQNRLASVLELTSKAPTHFQVILLDTKRPIASYAGGDLIILSKGIVIGLQSEAELAFILAHEMAHQHLGHDPEVLLDKKDEGTEIEADRLAAATIIAAGYDPRMAISALKNSYRYATPYLVEDDYYPSLEKRIDTLIEFLETTGWQPPGTVNRREFRDFRAALAN
jgi:predicted Zn-dependent protease